MKRLTPEERKRLTQAMKNMTPEQRRQMLAAVKKELAKKEKAPQITKRAS